MNWGTRIVLSYIGFISIIAIMVTISMKQDVYLVSKDYYKEEINYQAQIDRIQNNKSEGKDGLQVKHDTSNGVLQLTSPKGKSIEAELHFFRPSDATRDKKMNINLEDAKPKEISLNDFQKGLWKVKVNWTVNSKSFYTEKTIVL